MVPLTSYCSRPSGHRCFSLGLSPHVTMLVGLGCRFAVASLLSSGGQFAGYVYFASDSQAANWAAVSWQSVVHAQEQASPCWRLRSYSVFRGRRWACACSCACGRAAPPDELQDGMAWRYRNSIDDSSPWHAMLLCEHWMAAGVRARCREQQGGEGIWGSQALSPKSGRRPMTQP